MEKTIFRSPFFYVGDKFKLLSQIKDHFPKKIKRFIEPFCGGGSVFLNIEAEEYFENDVDKYMIGLHRFLIEQSSNSATFWKNAKNMAENYGLSATFLGKDIPHEYREKYHKTYFAQYNKAAYARLRQDFNADKSDMMRLYFLLIYGFNRMIRFNSKGDFNLPVGNVDFNKNVEKSLNLYFSFAQTHEIHLSNNDFESFVNSVAPEKNDFVYLDPPYLITFSEYNKLWTEHDEERLLSFLDYLNSQGIRFALSNVIWHKNRYNAICNAWAQKYDIVRIKSNYISYHDNTDKKSYEVLIKNY